MSWLSQIAGRAEALLENLDNATASSMEKAGIGTPRQTPSDQETPGRGREEEEHTDSTLSFTSGSSLGPSQPVRGGAQATPTTPTQDRSLPLKSPPAPAKEYDDDSLFEFLNTPSRPPRTAKRGSGRGSSTGGRVRSSRPSGKVARGPSATAGQLRAPPPPSDTASDVMSVGSAEQVVVVTSGGPPQQEGAGGGGVVGGASADTPLEPPPGKAATDTSWLATPEEMQSALNVSHDTSHDMSHDPSHDAPRGEVPSEDPRVTTLKAQVSSLELENKLLRREVTSLNEEGRQLAVRVRNLQDSNASFQQEAMKGREKVMSLEEELADHTHQLSDAQTALDSQTSKVQALQRQLSSVNEELDRTKTDSARAVSEKERLMRDATDVSGAHTTAVTSLKQQLAAAQEALSQEQEGAAQMQGTLTVRQAELEMELRDVQVQLTTARGQVAEEAAHKEQLVLSLATAEEEVAALRQEHADYRHKATSILQAKDREIAVLECGGRDTAKEEQLQQAALQRTALEEEVGRQREAAQELQGELKTIVEQSEVEVGQLEACLAVAEESLSQEKASHSGTQSELSRLRVDLEASRRELLQQTSTLTMQLQERDARLADLQSQVSHVSAPPTANEGAELESRLQELTETLIQRQTLVETLTSEKHSLSIQLEELRRQQKEGVGQGEGHQGSHSVVISGLEVEKGTSSQMRSMSSVLPSVLQPGRHRWSQRMHSAANSLDSFSVRLGVFLRRHPHARLFLVLYGALLHLWVLVVLMTYSPEVHPDSTGPTIGQPPLTNHH